ncbi:ABC transporter ATP-binding protein [Flindersiella endophytica]
MLSRLFTYRPGLLLASTLLWTAGFCMPILTGLVNQAVFDELQPDTSTGRSLGLLFAALVVVAVAEPVLMVCWQWTHVTLEAVVDALVRTNLFAWIVARSGRNARAAAGPVTALGNLRDDVPGYTGLVNEWYRIVGEAAFVVVALVILIRIDPLVTLVTFVPLCAVVAGTHWMRSRLPRLWGQARDATNDVTTLVADTFAGVQTVKAAGAEAAVACRLAEVNNVRMHAEIRSLVAGARIDAVSQAAILTGQGLVLLVGAGAMLAGRFTIGDFVVFGIYLDWMLELPRRVGRLLSQRRTSRQSLVRLQDTMNDGTPVTTLARHRPFHPREPAEPAGDRPGGDADEPGERLEELELDGISYTHESSGQGISNVSLRLRRGTITVVAGGVGAGKSTLLEVLLGLRAAAAGRIRWNGEMVDEPADFMRPPRVAYKPQAPRLFSDTLRENVLLGLRADDARLTAALRDAALTYDLRHLGDGLDTLVGGRGVRLSGGQQQRAAAARMLYRQAELYVIDDLSSALDDRTENEIWQRLSAARRAGATFVVVSHHPAALKHADQVVRLEAGRLTNMR